MFEFVSTDKLQTLFFIQFSFNNFFDQSHYIFVFVICYYMPSQFYKLLRYCKSATKQINKRICFYIFTMRKYNVLYVLCRFSFWSHIRDWHRVVLYSKAMSTIWTRYSLFFFWCFSIGIRFYIIEIYVFYVKQFWQFWYIKILQLQLYIF